MKIALLIAIISTTSLIAASKPMSREKLKNIITGKTQPEVMRLIGKPHMVTSGGEGEIWVYKDITFHPVTKDFDMHTLVQFGENKRVIEVRF